MTADSDAFAVVKQLGLPPQEEQYLMPVARGEGFYGLGWGNPNAQTIAQSEQFGIDPRAGVGSNNWGAEMGTGSAGSFPHLDHHADGSPFVGQYKKHKTRLEGAASIARTLLKPNVKEALRTGFYPGPVQRFKNPSAIQRAQFDYKAQFSGKTIEPIMAAVFSQSDNGYFELHPQQYLKAVKVNYDKLTQALQWTPLLTSIKTIPETIATTPLSGSPSLGLPDSSSGEPSENLNGNVEEPEGGIIRGQKYCVPGIQDE